MVILLRCQVTSSCTPFHPSSHSQLESRNKTKALFLYFYFLHKILNMQETPTQSQISGLRPQSTEGGWSLGQWVEWTGGWLGSQLVLRATRVPDLCRPWLPQLERVWCAEIDLPTFCQESQPEERGCGRTAEETQPTWQHFKNICMSPKCWDSVSTLFPSSPIKQVLKEHTRGYFGLWAWFQRGRHWLRKTHGSDQHTEAAVSTHVN